MAGVDAYGDGSDLADGVHEGLLASGLDVNTSGEVGDDVLLAVHALAVLVEREKKRFKNGKN